MDFWLAGISNDPMYPFGADLFPHVDRTIAFAWLIQQMKELGEAAEPFIIDVQKVMADPRPDSAGVVVAWMDEDDGVETRAFVMLLTLNGTVR